MRQITITQAVLDLLRARRISHRFGGGERWRLGQSLYFEPSCELEPYCEIFSGQVLPTRMGAFSYSGSTLSPLMKIGRYCSIGPQVEVVLTTHPTDWVTSSPFSYAPGGHAGVLDYWQDTKAAGRKAHPFPNMNDVVELGHDVWVGQGAAFTRGVTVGNGAIIAARAVVTKDVPPYAVVGGSPARLIRMRLPDEIAAGLQASQWWLYGPDVLHELDPRDPAAFLARLGERLAKEPLPTLSLAPLTAAEIEDAAAQPR
jgi:acetyltransferase-like isoleucine patch superfamily enzyme